MSAVKVEEAKVETQPSLTKPATTGLSLFNDFFAPMFPMGRFFGLNPLTSFQAMREFNEEMNRMFRTGTPVTEGPAMQAWTPTVDVQRANGDLVVTAELPGLKKEEVRVEMTETALTIEGERRQEHTEDQKGFHRVERSYGSFYRSIPLPEGTKTELAKAELKDGLLRITVPMPEAKPAARQIPIQSAAA